MGPDGSHITDQTFRTLLLPSSPFGFSFLTIFAEGKSLVALLYLSFRLNAGSFAIQTELKKKKEKRKGERGSKGKRYKKKSLPWHIKSGLTLLLLKRLSSVKNGVLAVSDVAAFYSRPFNRDSTRFNEENWEFFLQRGIPRYFFLSPRSILTSE